MITHIIEATDSTNFNWGKFLVCRFTAEEYRYPSALATGGSPLLPRIGHNPDDILVVDLQTCEGAVFSPGRYAHAGNDLEKDKVWVCPMYEPFLTWLYQQDLTDLTKLPPLVNLGKVPTAMYGYRRSGVGQTDRAAAVPFHSPTGSPPPSEKTLRKSRSKKPLTPTGSPNTL